LREVKRGILVKKNNDTYNKMNKYKSHVICGLIGVTLLGITVISADVVAGENARLKNNDEEVAVLPSAGIAKLFSNETLKNAEDTTLNTNKEFVGGIATVLGDYYLSEINNRPSLKAVDTVLKMLPEDKVEEEQSEDNNSEEGNNEQEEQVTSVVDGYTVLGVANVTNYLNVRETPDVDGELLGKLPMNAGCEILETLDGWYKISSGNVEGYVSAEFLLTGEEANERADEVMSNVARVNADMLMVREEPNTDCTILTRIAEGEEVEAVEVMEGWVKVNIDNRIGYVSADYVDVYKTLPKGVTLKELSYGDGVSNTAVDLIEYAKQFLGNPYVYGGTSLTNGTDCSGFTMRVFQQFGYCLSRTSREQAYDGTRVSLSDIQPGDLLFYSYGGTIGHVAIYIGNGQIIHASTEKTGIIISNAFYTTPTCATRIIN
jgi:uncharacterized protein YgiM (DUF1202 family)